MTDNECKASVVLTIQKKGIYRNSIDARSSQFTIHNSQFTKGVDL
jgi:hypothetical protein